MDQTLLKSTGTFFRRKRALASSVIAKSLVGQRRYKYKMCSHFYMATPMCLHTLK
uniref:Uncharacterized protein n=1 Tax=Anguilla anguilla TaxID=7936 RepID=A0A0E9WMW8_ANGAN